MPASEKGAKKKRMDYTIQAEILKYREGKAIKFTSYGALLRKQKRRRVDLEISNNSLIQHVIEARSEVNSKIVNSSAGPTEARFWNETGDSSLRISSVIFSSLIGEQRK